MNALARHGASLRRMVLSDLDAVMAIETRCYSFPWTRGNFVDSLAAGYHAQVLLEHDELIGYLVAMAGVGEMHLLNITVAPMAQHRGLARRMLDELQHHCAQSRLPLLWLEVRASNHRARALYARRGFEEVGVRRNYYPASGGREDAIVMRLPLAGAHRVD